jgi:SAM-dependent methyltransferase
MRYTFGNDEAATRRLEDIAEFFNPLATEFVRTHVRRPVDIAVDLGCGPGFTTGMLAKALPGAAVTGIDRSSASLEAARARFPRHDFVEHDVTDLPLPVEAGVMYARFLLSHLSNPVELVNAWARGLRPGGTLLLEEFENIHTDVPVFQKYLDVSAEMVASGGSDLCVGAILGRGKYVGSTTMNEAVLLPVRNHCAAKWSYWNTAHAWKNSERVAEILPVEERRAMSKELARIRDSGDERADITWRLRRLVLEA